jgi:hypothetical protein
MSPVPHLTPAVTAVVIGAGALHACWNAIAKQVQDRLMAFAWIGIAATIAGGAVLLLTGMPYRPAIAFAIASAVIHVGHDLALMNSYRLGAFKQTYPIARGTSPLLVAAGAVVAAIRRPAASWRDRAGTERGLVAGILCIVAYGIVLWARRRRLR